MDFAAESQGLAPFSAASPLVGYFLDPNIFPSVCFSFGLAGMSGSLHSVHDVSICATVKCGSGTAVRSFRLRNA